MDLKEWRKKYGVTQMFLAAKIGVSLMTIQLWERKITIPNEENGQKLKDVMKEIELQSK